ncbi:MAG: hypothetical protein OXB95_01265 [Rhodobacteraceae bacterium]|nr:hypothetical protein [Paracoccaceae bacterium]
MFTAAEFKEFVRSFARTDFYSRYRKSICRTDALAQVIVLPERRGRSPARILWSTVGRGFVLRPLPPAAAQGPTRIDEVFGCMFEWVRARKFMLCVERDACLSRSPINWQLDELVTLFKSLRPKTFKAGVLAPLLADFLKLNERSQALKEAVGQHLVTALQAALLKPGNMAQAKHISDILRYVPERLLFRLPSSIQHRELLVCLACAEASILPVRSDWCSESGALSGCLSHDDLEKLLNELAPFMNSARANQASRAALAFLAGHSLPELAARPRLASLKVIRAREVRTGQSVALSLEELSNYLRTGTLFAESPDANKFLPLVADALPDSNPLVVGQNYTEFLRQHQRPEASLQFANRRTVLKLTAVAEKFGSDLARAKLIQELRPVRGDDREALRKLCAGHAGDDFASARLWIPSDSTSGVEDIVNRIIAQSEREFLVPSSVARELSPSVHQFLGFRELDMPAVESLLHGHMRLVAGLTLSPAECEALLLSVQDRNLLRQLPMHRRSDGTVGGAENAYVVKDFPVPHLLRDHVVTIDHSESPEGRQRQFDVLDLWSPVDQIRVTVDLDEPHLFLLETLDALAHLRPDDMRDHPGLLNLLRTKRWLVANQFPVAPEYVLSLPDTVDEAAGLLFNQPVHRSVFVPLGCLQSDIHLHSAFDILRERILLSQDESFSAIALLVNNAGIVGRPGPVDSDLIRAFAILAVASLDPGFPGWKLIAATLAALGDDTQPVLDLVKEFACFSVEDTALAAEVLDRLAGYAHREGEIGRAAEHIYESGFRTVAKWPREAFRKVFAVARVPTGDGNWRMGREVVESGAGVSRAHVLDPNFADTLRNESQDNSWTSSNAEMGSTRPAADFARAGRPYSETEAMQSLRRFLEPWRGHVPSDLVVILLGLLGRNRAYAKLAEEWSADTTAAVDTLWSSLDSHFPSDVLHPESLSAEVGRRIYRIEEVAGNSVQVRALSGHWFSAPVDQGSDEILIGDPRMTHRSVYLADDDARDMFTLYLRVADPAALAARGEAVLAFRGLARRVGADCLALLMDRQQEALDKALDKAVTLDQTTLLETERFLRDQLPSALSTLKLSTTNIAHEALRDYEQRYSHLSRLDAGPEDLDKLKTELWDSISSPDSAKELLAALRSKIRDFGYSPERVVLELFQNADDAYRQLNASTKDACFRFEVTREGAGGFRTIHWGRPINHLGRHPDEGRRRGLGKDLLNMLLLSFSDKRPEDKLTGKFGLGFKVVHALSESVGIASGFIGLRTAGGFLPTHWPDGVKLAERHRSESGQRATVIEVPFSNETSEDGHSAVSAFGDIAPILVACARAIRRIEIHDENPTAYSCEAADFLNDKDISVVAVQGRSPRRALRLNLDGDFRLFVDIGAHGPKAYSSTLAGLWNLAPLEEDLGSGWVLDGPFAVDPGRSRLSGSVDERRRTFKTLGNVLGDRLVRLHELSLSDWPAFAEALHLRCERPAFWSRLFELLQGDLADERIRHLHTDRRGLGRLVAERRIVPTRLPPPLDESTIAGEIKFRTAGAMDSEHVQKAVSNWSVLRKLPGRIVASEVAKPLQLLGFREFKTLNLADLIKRELKGNPRMSRERAGRLGHLLNAETIRTEPLSLEESALLPAASKAHFQARDGQWQPVRELISASANNEDEKLLCRFAPNRAILGEKYTGDALSFFRVARRRSGYNPQARLLWEWARNADSDERRLAVYRYFVDGTQGRALAELCRETRPMWMHQSIETLKNDPLLSDWNESDRRRLKLELGIDSVGPLSPQSNSKRALEAIWAWWSEHRSSLCKEYDRRVYPSFLSPAELHRSDDRTTWFTMFSLACFRTIGRTQDEQHRSFVERSYKEGWWQEIARVSPDENVEAWVQRLENWSSAQQHDQEALPWRRILVDQYVICRWLTEYIEIVRKLPRIVENHGIVSLENLLRPSYSPQIASLGIDAAPIYGSLGIGFNWIIRELLRNGFYESRYEHLLAPYCWSSTGRVRRLLIEMGAELQDSAGIDNSRAIHGFVSEQVGDEAARFEGDYDLPLHEITRWEHRHALRTALAETGISTGMMEDADEQAD